MAELTGETRPPDVGESVVLPDGWEWAEPSWHPLNDPIWKSYRMAKHSDGRLANFESRAPIGGRADDV